VLAAQTELAQRQAKLRQQELVAEIVKPAEAEAERVRILAAAEAQRMKVQAEAAASYDRVALDRMLIDQLPLIVKEAAGGLSGANVNVLNGADGLGEIAAGLVAQGLTILDSVRQNLNGHGGQNSGGRPEEGNGRLELQGPDGAKPDTDERQPGDDSAAGDRPQPRTPGRPHPRRAPQPRRLVDNRPAAPTPVDNQEWFRSLPPGGD